MFPSILSSSSASTTAAVAPPTNLKIETDRNKYPIIFENMRRTQGIDQLTIATPAKLLLDAFQRKNISCKKIRKL